MKKSTLTPVLGFLLTIGFLLSVAAAYGNDENSESKAKPTCEYKVVHATQFATDILDYEKSAGELDAKFNEMAAKGWVFEHEMTGFLVFQRDK